MKIYSLVALIVWVVIIPFFVCMQIIFFVLDPFFVHVFDFPPLKKDEYPLKVWVRGAKKIVSKLHMRN